MFIALILIIVVLVTVIVMQRRQSVGRLLTEGIKAPDFELPDQDGKIRRLSDYAGKPLVLVFYPVDASPACSLEMARITAGHEEIRATGAEVLGVSVQGGESHKRFCSKVGIPYPLLSDTNRVVSKAYGATGSNKGLADRVTFIIDSRGMIAHVDANVDRHLFRVPGLWIEWIKANSATL